MIWEKSAYHAQVLRLDDTTSRLRTRFLAAKKGESPIRIAHLGAKRGRDNFRARGSFGNYTVDEPHPSDRTKLKRSTPF